MQVSKLEEERSQRKQVKNKYEKNDWQFIAARTVHCVIKTFFHESGGNYSTVLRVLKRKQSPEFSPRNL